MATNKILPWAQTGTANVLSDDAYAAGVAEGGLYGGGVKTGQASSQQANKTWRQATAPGSGLGQFLVDNLSVDVTDSDTPATFSSRIANAVLKLSQISPFNQSWAVATGGYRKYAIVSDSLGNYWSSTADQNVTVPGAAGAKWKSLFDGYATQAWATGQFVQTAPADENNAGAAYLGVQTTLGYAWLNYENSAGNLVEVILADRGWVNGNFATLNGLASEATARSNADKNLAQAITDETTRAEGAEAQKANLAGGNSFSGTQSVAGDISVGRGHIVSIADSTGAGSLYTCPEYHASGYLAGINAVTHVLGTNGNYLQWMALNGSDGSVWTSTGQLAFVSQLPTSGTITNGTYTKVPLNDGSGRFVLTQTFTVTASDWHNITFPIAFSSVPTLQLTPQHNPTGDSGAASNITNYYKESLTVSGFTLDVRALWGYGSSAGQYNSVQTMVYAQGIL